MYSTLVSLKEILACYDKIEQPARHLYAHYPENMDFKIGLAFSYLKITREYIAMFDLTNALASFKEMSRLFVERFDVYSTNPFFKHKEAGPYSEVRTYKSLGTMEETFASIEKDVLSLIESYDDPKSDHLKKELVIGYLKLGEMQTEMGNPNKALEFYGRATELMEILYAKYPENINFKIGLAFLFQRLGDTHKAIGNRHNALPCYKRDIEISIELSMNV